jgi:creatinine amidohydrolase
MSRPTRFWADLTTRDFAQLRARGGIERVVAVLPVAAIEQHGPHLPLSVDTDIVDGMVQATLPHIPADVHALELPTQQVGLSTEHVAFPGTLTLSAETTMRLWTEIGESVARAGVRKLVLFNAHGGHAGIIDAVARELRGRCKLLVVSTSWYSLPLGEAGEQFSADEHRFGIHAGEIETSLMLALRPERVDMAQAEDFASTSRDRAQKYAILGNGRSAKFAWHMQDYNPAGAAGNAAAATAEKGRKLLDAGGRQFALLLQEIAQLPLSTLVDAPRLD